MLSFILLIAACITAQFCLLLLIAARSYKAIPATAPMLLVTALRCLVVSSPTELVMLKVVYKCLLLFTTIYMDCFGPA